MKRILSPLLLIVTALFTYSVIAADSPEVAAEKKKLDGTWVGGVKGGSGGGPGKGKGKSKGPGGGGSASGMMVNITELVIKDGKITAKGDRDSVFGGGTYTLNLGTKPMTLDAVGTSGKEAGRNHPGIYRWNGDKLEWCVSNPGIPRPTDFHTTPQVQFHMILTKQK